ncbi:hypothetical protein HPB52_018102 [Rhipicephalus sanguineus]|uniref:Uncharacterized protein n=1 Tax=Rhipicephalus sanguineus TaxID=34632 RepID=A0A9D4QAT2_RHISA|nr:hypothetical protein HPB52_018102 [Rhipicephalus sanguineus]
MHDILLDALPAELRHMSAASSSSPQPYDDLCAAVLARYGETTARYRGPVSSGFPLRQRERYHPARSPPIPTTYLPRLRLYAPLVRPPAHWFPRRTTRPTMFRIPRPTTLLLPIDQSATRCVSSTTSADGPSGMPAIRPSSLASPARDTSLTTASTLAALPPTWKLTRTTSRPLFAPRSRRFRRQRYPNTTFHRLLSSAPLVSSDQCRPRRLPQQKFVPLTNSGRTCRTLLL